MRSVEHEMQRVGRIIAADQALRVHVRGVQAFAVPGEVTIPNIEQYDWLGRNAARMLHGLLDHECGHASDTDFEALRRWRETVKPCQALNRLENIVEDGYVERLQGQRYRGCGTNIRLMNEWFYEQKLEDGRTAMQHIEDPKDIVSAVFGAINAVLTPHGHRSIEFFEKLNPTVGAALRMVQPELEEAMAVNLSKQSAANISIAERIFAKLASMGGGGGGGSSKDQHVAPGAGGDPKEGEGDPTDAADGEGKDKDGKGEAEADPPVMDLERWTEESGAPISATDFTNRRMRDIFKMPDDVLPYIVYSHEWDVERDFSAEDMSKLTDDFEIAKSDVREVADAMIFAFEAALRSTALITPVSGADEGEVDPELLVQFAVGSVPSDQLYVQRDEGESDETAVEILGDCSGSMSGSPAELLQRTAIAMHMALQACQIAHEITGFTTVHSHHGMSHPWCDGIGVQLDRNFREMQAAMQAARERGTDLSRFARSMTRYGGDMSVPFHAIFKNWATNDARALMKIRGIANNLDGEAVLWAARRLARRPERRKVLFVLSDGHPAGSRDNAQGARYLSEAVGRVIASGMEVYGIGMQSDAVQKFYPHWWVADDMDDLIGIAMNGLTEVLTMNRRERARVFL